MTGVRVRIRDSGSCAVVILLISTFLPSGLEAQSLQNGTIGHSDEASYRVVAGDKKQISVAPQSARQPTGVSSFSGSKEIEIKLPSELAHKSAEIEAESASLQIEKKKLDEEFLQIIAERDRLAKDQKVQGDIYENQKYNDAVFRLNGRIADYQKRCDEYEAKVAAFNDKIQAFR